MNTPSYLILISHRNARGGYKPHVLRKPPKRVADGPVVILNLDTSPPCVVSADPRTSYPFFAKHLPDQFVDHEGSLRDKTGKLIFAGPRVPNRSHVIEPADYPFTRNDLGKWLKSGATPDRSDLVDMISLSPKIDTL